MMFMCLHYVALAFVLLGNITSLESVLSEFLQASTTPEEQIRLFFENINHRLHYYRGEWTKALEYQRTSLLQLRNQKMLQDIAGMNKLLAMTYIELQRFADEGVLSEAEMVLVENLEFWNADIWAQVQLVAVYSLQNRFQEAHALLAEIDKAPDIFRLQAKTDLALAERCWDQAASAAQSLLKLMQSAGNRWYWARRLIDLGDIYSQREQPGDLERARATYQQSLDMFSEMEATGYIAVLHRRLQALSLQ